MARAGLRVQVLERKPWVGGAAVSRSLYKDFTYSNCSYVCSLLRPEIMRDLELPRHGLQVIPYEGGGTLMSNGDHFYTLSAADFLDEYFESEIVKAHLAGTSIIGTGLGPRSPGTAYVLLHHYMGDIDDTVGAWGFARGGMGAISKALGASFAG